MQNFSFLFGLMLAEQILKHTDNLSHTLQPASLSAVEAQSISQLCVSVLQDMRTDSNFSLFWDLVLSTQRSLGMNDPVFPRQRKWPPRYEEGAAQPYFPLDPKQFYKPIYFESLDAAIQAITDHFVNASHRCSVRMRRIKIELTEDIYGSSKPKSLEVGSCSQSPH